MNLNIAPTTITLLKNHFAEGSGRSIDMLNSDIQSEILSSFITDIVIKVSEEGNLFEDYITETTMDFTET